MLNKFRNNDKGFTLVELMMVIVILGVLAGVAIPSISRMRANAEKAKLNSYADSYGTAVLMDMMASNATDLSHYTSDDQLKGLVSISGGDDVTVAQSVPSWNPENPAPKYFLHISFSKNVITVQPYYNGKNEGIDPKTFTIPD